MRPGRIDYIRLNVDALHQINPWLFAYAGPRMLCWNFFLFLFFDAMIAIEGGCDVIRDSVPSLPNR